MDAPTDRIAEKLDEILAWTTDFAAEQAPLVAEEVINFAFWESAIVAVVCGAILVVLAILYRHFYPVRSDRQDDADWFMGQVLFNAFAGIAVIWPIIFGFTAIHCLLKVTLAPRLYILEYISELL
jgi:hypothetical protein